MILAALLQHGVKIMTSDQNAPNAPMTAQETTMSGRGEMDHRASWFERGEAEQVRRAHETGEYEPDKKLRRFLTRWRRIIKQVVPDAASLDNEQLEGLALLVLLLFDVVWDGVGSDGRGRVSFSPQQFTWTDLVFAVFQSAVEQLLRTGHLAEDNAQDAAPPVPLLVRGGRQVVHVDAKLAKLLDHAIRDGAPRVQEYAECRHLPHDDRIRQLRMVIRSAVHRGFGASPDAWIRRKGCQMACSIMTW
jgi:hypothetical protein